VVYGQSSPCQDFYRWSGTHNHVFALFVEGSRTKDESVQLRCKVLALGPRDHHTDVVVTANAVFLPELDTLTSAGATRRDNTLPVPLERAARTRNLPAIVPGCYRSVEHVDEQEIIASISVHVGESQI
jgi:hypothetical protein